METASKICRICLTFSSTSSISKTRRSGSNYRRFCSEINYTYEGELDHGNVSICGECMPLVEAVSTSKCRLEEVEGHVLKLQQKLLKMLRELEEKIEDHSKDVEKLEEIVNGSSQRKEVFERLKADEVNNMMEFRKGIVDVAKDLRAFRTNIQEKIMTTPDYESVPQLLHREEHLVKLEGLYSPLGSPLIEELVDYDPLWLPDDDIPLSPSPKQRKPRLTPTPSCSTSTEPILPSSDSEGDDDEPPPKRRRGGLEFIKSTRGKDHLIYKGYRYLLHTKSKSSKKYHWICALTKQNGCRVIVHTEEDEVTAIRGKHNHPQDLEKIEAMRIINKIKEAGVTSGATIQSIIEKEVGDGAISKLPCIKSIATTIRNRNKRLNRGPSGLGTNPDEFDTDLSGPVEFVKSGRGNNHLVFKGHRFSQRLDLPTKHTWCCVKRRTGKCRAYLHLKNNEVTLYKNNHTHSASMDPAQVEVMNLLHKLKEESHSSTKSASEIVASNATGVSEDVAAKLPSITEYLTRVKRKRALDKRKRGDYGARVKEEVIPLTGPLEYIKSCKGKDHLLYEGYRYMLRNDTKTKTSVWRCAIVNRCRGLLHIKNGCIVHYNKEHHHPPESAEKIETKKLMISLKETCLTSTDNPSELLAGAKLGDLKVDSVKRVIQKTRQLARSPVSSEGLKDQILARNPEIFLMEEFMQEIVTAMITKQEQRRLKKTKLDQFGFQNHSFRFDWNEKKIFLGEVEIFVNESTKSVQCSQCQKWIGPGATFALATQIFDHIVGEHFGAYKCHICLEGFDTHKDFQVHVSNHVNPEEPCDICGRPVTEGRRQLHRATHMNEEERKRASKEIKYSCSICGKSFLSKTAVKRHEKKH